LPAYDINLVDSVSNSRQCIHLILSKGCFISHSKAINPDNEPISNWQGRDRAFVRRPEAQLSSVTLAERQDPVRTEANDTEQIHTPQGAGRPLLLI